MLVLPGSALATDCRADLDGDGTVGAADLAILLGDWGLVDSPANFNGDDEGVACFDLTFLQGNWGDCTCEGDADGDGVVGPSDQKIVLETWGNDCSADLDQNGVIDGNDIDALQCQWGTDDPAADLDGDGTVGIADLTQALAAFGTLCLGDVNRDGGVNIADLTTVLANWGVCP